MSRRKTKFRKSRLTAESKRASAIPAWVMLRTGGRVRIGRRRRNWRRSKIKI